MGMGNRMLEGYNNSTHVNMGTKIINIPNNVDLVNNTCNVCYSELEHVKKNKSYCDYECSNCRGSFFGYGIKNCECSYSDVTYNYNICISCTKQELDNYCCSKCNVYISPSKYEDIKECFKDIIFSRIYMNKKFCETCKLCNKCSDNYCDNCWVNCIKCNNNIKKYFNENCCKDCTLKCSKCENKTYKNIIKDGNQYCEKCFYNNFDPTNCNEKYKLNLKRINNYHYEFISFIKIEEMHNCKKCDKKYWWWILDGIDKPYWQCHESPYLQDCCEKHFNRRLKRKRNNFIKKNPDPSNNESLYVLREITEKPYFEWYKEYNINICKNCSCNIKVYSYYDKKNYIYCKKCNPSNKYHKFKWIDDKWILDKVYVLKNNRHHWINPTREYNINYKCNCHKCN